MCCFSGLVGFFLVWLVLAGFDSFFWLGWPFLVWLGFAGMYSITILTFGTYLCVGQFKNPDIGVLVVNRHKTIVLSV